MMFSTVIRIGKFAVYREPDGKVLEFSDEKGTFPIFDLFLKLDDKLELIDDIVSINSPNTHILLTGAPEVMANLIEEVNRVAI